MTRDKHRSPVPDRARRRAIRAHAARLGVSYSVAARLLRTRPPGFSTDPADDHRAWLSAARERRRFAVRVTDTRRAADLPLGRAGHLTERFPPVRAAVESADRAAVFDGADRATVFDGADRATVLGLLYTVLAVESPDVLPSPAELAWVAELGEEDAVDVACAGPDRAARLLLDGDRWRLWTRVEAALAAAVAGTDRRLRDAARTLDGEFRTVVLRHSVAGARQILDAVLAPAEHGTAPGTRVRLAGGGDAVVVGVRWTVSGPPTGYEVRVAGGSTVPVGPDDVEPLPGATAPVSPAR
ncbi:hypothetical protein [Virgisporangium ochraceum]|uniref:Uncharacterized protein n=1 Tax=Virgisporangium ochraceum TaxID=65505 RepID=A0A8J3ZN01_9ACTN|nr:hypothetical protein [Virgisporangium ochraceum]GIJ67052.1 hypothetical protein Voc01_019690 [Virgisporangium ochraceum]